MDTLIVKGCVAAFVTMNIFLLAHSVPVPDFHGNNDSPGVTDQTPPSHETTQVPDEFKNYVQLIDLLKKLQELKGEINRQTSHNTNIYNEESVVRKPQQLLEILHSSWNGQPQPRQGGSEDSELASLKDGSMYSLVAKDQKRDTLTMNDKPELFERVTDVEKAVYSGNIMDNGERLHAIDNQQGVRTKRDVPTLSLSNICTTPECLKQLVQFLAWRQKNGYPVDTGVWKVGK